MASWMDGSTAARAAPYEKGTETGHFLLALQQQLQRRARGPL